jgi:pimeloyl-ACP methyl ester carboxylesterase
VTGSAQISRGLVMTSAGYVHYRSAGDGPVVALFHINAQSSSLMVELIEALAAGGVRAIAIDYPSHGSSDHVTDQPTINDYARWALEVFDGLGIDKFTALGEATGSVVAAELVAQAPDRASALVLVNCPYIPPGTEYPERVKVTDDLRPADASGFPVIRSLEFMLTVDPTHSPVHPTQEWLDRLNTAQIEAGRQRWQAITALKAHDIDSSFVGVKCPTLLLTGSRFYLAGNEGRVLSQISGSRAVTIDNAAFCATWEHAGFIADQALEFLGEVVAP